MEQVGNSKYTEQLSLGLNQLRQEGTLCDVTIVIDNQNFLAHRVVLCASNRYFNSMFTSGFQEGASSVINLHFGSAKGFTQILEFAYTGYFQLSAENVCDVLSMACNMDLAEVIDSCLEYITKMHKYPNIEDSYELYLLSKLHQDVGKVTEILRLRLLKDFSNFAKSECFLQTSKEFLDMCLNSQEIEFDSTEEEEILQNVMKWLRSNWSQRKIHTPDLLKKIRLGLVPVDKLMEILGDEVLVMPNCKAMVDGVVKLHATNKISMTVPLIQSHPELFAARSTITEYVCQSKSPHPNLKICYYYHLYFNECTVAILPRRLFAPIWTGTSLWSRYPFGDIVVGNQFYLAGGSVRHHCQEAQCPGSIHFFRYNPSTNEWKVLPPLLRPYLAPVLVELHGYIYALPKYKDEDRTVQRYHIEREEWEIVTSVPYNLNQVIAMSCQGCIFVAGGDWEPSIGHRVGQYRRLVYNPKHKRWFPCLVHNIPDNVSSFTWFVHHKGIWYCSFSYQIHRFTCDFTSESPSMTIGEWVDEEEIFGSKVRCRKSTPKFLSFSKYNLKEEEEI